MAPPMKVVSVNLGLPRYPSLQCCTAYVGFCEGFRMPAGSNRATDAGGRRTKTSKGRNRDLGALGGPRRATCSVMGI